VRSNNNVSRHRRLMKWVIVIFNVVAAGMLILLGSFAVVAHQTHAYSVYKELQAQHVLVERPDYDVEKRLRTIAAGGTYSSSIASVAAGVCLVNAIMIGFLWRRSSTTANKSLQATAAAPASCD
jgi:ABC-type spermidine/putrescine transport system permease subunit I